MGPWCHGFRGPSVPRVLGRIGRELGVSCLIGRELGVDMFSRD
jgi:hypothetical protein